MELFDFIEIKGWKAIGNKLTDKKVMTIEAVEAESSSDKKSSISGKPNDERNSPTLFDQPEKKEKGNGKLEAGDTIDFDI